MTKTGKEYVNKNEEVPCILANLQRHDDMETSGLA